ncbi:Cyclin, C-terminal domain [Musa troglodytarum]|uniref:Cyclin, C-terminal domain n=1 Tax=Musa troglodytarum TaxID=320322 RepID=A0A9E7KI73_9LILI|nr:Cyclin, C-terminal domain [Musa troglodytarum]
MSPSCDCASSILLCAEDNDSILGFDDGEEEGGHRPGWVSEPKRCDFYGDILAGFPLQSDELLSLLVEREQDHLPREDYRERLRSGALDPSIRRDAIDWIWKQGKAWMTQLLSVACLSLAAKMEETEVPLSLDLQVGEAKYIFEGRTIQRMELLVMSTLKWRMQAVTPFSFIDFFLHKFNGCGAPSKLSVSRSAELILSTIRGIDFLAFRPSVISAAIALLVLEEAQIVDVEEALSCCSHVAKEGVLGCYEVIQDKVLMRKQSAKDLVPSVSCVPQSPVGVLHAACLSYKSDDATVVSHATCLGLSPASKRRKTTR